MIKRTIYLDRMEDLDLENIGCHFTADLDYKHEGGGSNGLTPKGNFKVDIFVRAYIVNEEATAISNANYANEKEVVLDMNQDIEVEVRAFPISGGLAKRFSAKANTGTRADLWVKKLK
jgi:hypothetical protein